MALAEIGEFWCRVLMDGWMSPAEVRVVTLLGLSSDYGNDRMELWECKFESTAFYMKITKHNVPQLLSMF